MWGSQRLNYEVVVGDRLYEDLLYQVGCIDRGVEELENGLSKGLLSHLQEVRRELLDIVDEMERLEKITHYGRFDD